jgi:hypothetical protein
MKNLILLLAFFLIVLNTDAMPNNNPKTELTPAQQVRVTEIENRLEEIKSMDFKSMSKNELKEVRMEMKEMKKEARALGNGIYLSVGAIIIIILLLILLV